MMKLRDFEPGSLKVMLMGPSGTGKTCLAATLGKRALLLDLNNGLASAKTFRDRWSKQREEVEVKQCWGEGPDVMWRKTASYVTSFAAKPTAEALIIDGLSDLAEASLGSLLKVGGKWTDTSPKPTTMAEWGGAIAQIERLFWKLKSLRALVVVIAHTMLVEQENGSMKQVLACYGKSLPGKIMAGFDEVWFTKVEGYGEKRVWTLQAASSSGVDCKTRRQLPEGSKMELGMDGLLGLVGWEGKGREDE